MPAAIPGGTACFVSAGKPSLPRKKNRGGGGGIAIVVAFLLSFTSVGILGILK